MATIAISSYISSERKAGKPPQSLDDLVIAGYLEAIPRGGFS
jgi:hypothetical protein